MLRAVPGGRGLRRSRGGCRQGRRHRRADPRLPETTTTTTAATTCPIRAPVNHAAYGGKNPLEQPTSAGAGTPTVALPSKRLEKTAPIFYNRQLDR